MLAVLLPTAHGGLRPLQCGCRAQELRTNSLGPVSLAFRRLPNDPSALPEHAPFSPNPRSPCEAAYALLRAHLMVLLRAALCGLPRCRRRVLPMALPLRLRLNGMPDPLLHGG